MAKETQKEINKECVDMIKMMDTLSKSILEDIRENIDHLEKYNFTEKEHLFLKLMAKEYYMIGDSLPFWSLILSGEETITECFVNYNKKLKEYSEEVKAFINE